MKSIPLNSRHFTFAILILAVVGSSTLAAERVEGRGENCDPSKGIIITQVNWGRTWRCGDFENAQLQRLGFAKTGEAEPSIDLSPASVLTAKDEFVPYVLLVEPGVYELVEFDVKVAKSAGDVGHFRKSKDGHGGDPKTLPTGSFSVEPGEIVYIGHFGLDCGAEPFLWRNYIDGRKEFELYVADFRSEYPALAKHPVQFRLFSSPNQALGNDYHLDNPVVK